MNRPVWGILLLSVMMAASGCGSDKSEPGAKADPASGSTTPTAAAEGGSSQSVHLLTDNLPKKSTMEGRWILVFYERMSGMDNDHLRFFFADHGPGMFLF